MNCAPKIFGDANLETDIALTPLAPGESFTFGDLAAELGMTTEPAVVVTTEPVVVQTGTINYIKKDKFRGRLVGDLLREIIKFDEAACGVRGEVTAVEEVFRGQSVETLLGAIKKFDEAACVRTGPAAEQSGTGTSGTGTSGTTTGVTGGTGTGGEVTDEMINEFIVNKRCV
jgi:hypothetical protein